MGSAGVPAGLALPAGVMVVGELGRGAHGVVYRVRRDGHDWAMKVFNDPVDAGRVALVGLRREAALLAWVGDGGLPQVHEVGVVGDRSYLIMDLVEGLPLSAVLAGGPAAVERVLEWGVQVGETLAAVHAVGLVHRDVKPDNIMIEPGGRLRLIDFGTAGQAGGGVQADLVVGTLRYCAPEQSGMIKRPVDARSDLYALGVVLFEALAGQAPFDSDDVAELLRMHVAMPAPRLDTLHPEVPAPLADAVATLLAKDPDDRYQTSVSLVADLRALLIDASAPRPAVAGVLDAADRVGLAPLIGRDAERAQLEQRWRRARGGHGGLAVVSGRPGSGKTRLVQELATVVREQALPVLWAACDGDAGPLSAIRAAVEHHLSRLRRSPPPVRDAAVAQVRDAAGAAATLLCRLSPALADVLTGSVPEPSSAADPDALTRATAAFLVELAQVNGGALLCLDDAPRADEASQAVLRLLAAELAGAPLLVVLTTQQPADGPAGLAEAVVAAADCVVALAALSADSVQLLVAAVARGLAVDPEVAERLAAGCGVSPFEVQEYVRAVVDAGLLVPHWGTVRLDLPGLDALALPADVFELILRRVDGVGPRCRELLCVGAAIGLRFDGDLAARVSDLDAAEAGELLDQAAARVVVEHQDGALRFVHDGIRRALLDGLDEPARRGLHQRIADVLHDVDSTDPAHVYALGRHCLHGEADRSPARAFRALLAAGRQALADGAPAESVLLLERASQLTDLSAADRGEADELLGMARCRAGQFTDALSRLDRALSARTAPVDRARILVHIHEVYLGAGDVDAARTTILRALAELRRRPPTHPLLLIVSSLAWFCAGLVVERLGLHTRNTARHARYELEAILLSNLSINYLFTLDPLGSVALSVRALYPASRLTPCDAYVRTRGILGAISRAVGLPSNTAFRRAERAAAALGDPAPAASVAWLRRVAEVTNTGDLRTLTTQITDRTGLILPNHYIYMAVHSIWLLLGAGYARPAQALRGQAVARLASADLAGHELTTLCGIATASALGRITEADTMLHRLEDQPHTHHNPSRQLLTLLAQATAAVEQQDIGATFDHIAADLAAMRLNPRMLAPSQLTIYPIMAYGRLDQCRRAAPEHRAAALAAADDAVNTLGKAPGPITKAHHRVAAAFLHHLRGEHRAALDILADAERRIGDVHAPTVSFETARLRARALAALGRPADATAAAAAALTLAELHGWPHRAQWIHTEFPDLRPTGTQLSGGTDHSTSQATHRQLLTALEQMTNAASGILDPSQLTRVALDQIIRLLSAERAFMFLADDDGHLRPHLGRDTTGTDLTELTDYGSTLVERVRRTREPLVVTGTDEGAALGSQSVVAHGLRSIMVAPLQFDGRLLGIVYLDSRIAKGMFTSADIGVLAALTTHIGAALETARAAQLAVSAESIRRERDLAETLRTAMADLSTTLNPTDVLHRLHTTAARVLTADRSWLATLDTDKIHISAGANPETHPDPDPASAADIDPALHHLLTADTPLLGDPDSTPPAAFHTAGPHWMAIPLRLADTPVGVIVLATDQPTGYSQAQLDIAGVLTNHAMTAYHNARLFAQTEQMATTDTLTGLANRRHFFTTALHGIALARRQHSPLAAAMIDIDHFKQVNDIHGHHTGDQVITTVAHRLAHTVRTTDVLGRYGGEEFALILPDTRPDGSHVIAERLRTAIADHPVDTDAGPLTITISIGVAHLTTQHTDVETLLTTADTALYQAKHAGRNRVVLADPPTGENLSRADPTT